MFRTTADHFDTMAKGTNTPIVPGVLAAECDLVISLGTAKSPGAKFPATLSVRADAVIE